MCCKTIFTTKTSNIDSRTNTSAQHPFKTPFSRIRLLRSRSAAKSFATHSGLKQTYADIEGRPSMAKAGRPNTPNVRMFPILEDTERSTVRHELDEGETSVSRVEIDVRCTTRWFNWTFSSASNRECRRGVLSRVCSRTAKKSLDPYWR